MNKPDVAYIIYLNLVDSNHLNLPPTLLPLLTMRGENKQEFTKK